MTLHRLRQFLCGLTGHTDVLRFDGHSVKLRCTQCNRLTPGWWPPEEVTRQKTHAVARFHRRLSQHRQVH
jgi:hypothetical protein